MQAHRIEQFSISSKKLQLKIFAFQIYSQQNLIIYNWLMLKQSPLSSRYIIFFVTFFSYSTLHLMRMSIPFIKLDIMTFFNISKFQVGLGDALLYITIGVSFLYRMITPVKQKQKTFFSWICICNFGFLLIPFMMITGINTSFLYFIALIIFGFFQTISWPVLLQVVHKYFQGIRDGCMLGFWSASGDLGNVIGFSVSTLIIYVFKLPSYTCLIVPGLSSIIFSVLVCLLKIEKQKSQQCQNEEIQINEKESLQYQESSQQILQKIKKTLRQPSVFSLIITISILKSILYSTLLWLPMYFQKSGFQEYKGYIPVVTNGMAIFGSLFFGIIYEKIGRKLIRDSILCFSLVVIAACFFAIKNIQFTWQNRLVLLVLIGIIGYLLMGNFNVLVANQVALMSNKLEISIKTLSSLVMASGNIFVGILQLIIGAFSSEDSSSVFLILLISTIISIISEGFRIIFSQKQKGQEIKKDIN